MGYSQKMHIYNEQLIGADIHINQINRIMCASKILTDLCFKKQKIKVKKCSVKVVYNVLVIKMCWQNIKKIVWTLMVNNQ